MGRFQVRQGTVGHGKKLRFYCKCSGKPLKISKRVDYYDLTK